nr:MAG TPA: hypothetical protein [Caudoviricetes sp.]
MVKRIRKDLVQRMENRIMAEHIVEEFVRQLIHTNDRGGAKEFLDTEDFYLRLEEKEVYCFRKSNVIRLDGEEFYYDFTYLTNLCLGLLEDKF